MAEFVKVQVKPGDIRKVNTQDLETFMRDNPGASVQAQDAPERAQEAENATSANGESAKTPKPEEGAEKALSASEDKARKAAQNKGA